MNKKLFFGLFAATSMLFATSCSNDELNVVQSENEAQVTFSLGLEGGIGSRAISDGTTANKLVYAVYNSDGNALPVFGEGVYQMTDQIGDITSTPHTVKITLAKGQTYKVAFWAQNSACGAYETSDLKNVTVSYDGLNNDEDRDAFFKTVEFSVAGDKSIDVVLKRPFAQINVGVEETDWNAAVASGIEIENSEVVINNAATSINLLTGLVSGTETLTYKLAAIPTEELMVDTDNDGTKEAYKWLSMSYILVNDTYEVDDDNDGILGDYRTTLNSLKFTFDPKSGNNIEFTEGLNTVPVQRNWRTNILGKILTGDITFNITIDPVYDGDIIYPNGTIEQELEMAATFGGTYTLTKDLTIPFLGVGGDFIFNIIEDVTLTSGSASDYGIIVRNGTTTINNEGKIHSKGGGIGVTNGASVIYNGGELYVDTESTSGRYLFYLEGEGSTVTINGGNFSWDKADNQKRAYIYANEGTIVYVKGGTFGKASTRSGYTAGILGDGTVIITGGTFGFDPTVWVAEGYKAIKNGDKWYVVANDVDAVAATTEDLKAALIDGNTVVMTNDVEISETESNAYGKTGINQTNGGTIDGGGNTLSVPAATGTWDSAINTTGGTIKNITIAAGFRGIFVNHNSTSSGKVYLENVVIDGPVYTISCDQGTNNGLEATNSIFNGWTSYAATIGDVKFVNCNFGEGAGYAFCRPYAPTAFVGCEFEAGYEIDARAAVTFENCTLNGVALTAENLATLVTSNTANAIVK